MRKLGVVGGPKSIQLNIADIITVLKKKYLACATLSSGAETSPYL